MTHSGRTYGQAIAIALRLATDPQNTSTVVYIQERTPQRIREWMHEWAKQFPALADWEQRLTFQHINELSKPKILPNITIDEWPEMPKIPPEVWSMQERLIRQCEILDGADPEIFKEKKS